MDPSKTAPIYAKTYELSLGYEAPKFIDYPPRNYTPPDKPSFVDIFKGDDTEGLLFKSYLMTKHTVVATTFASIIDIIVGTQPKDLKGSLARIGYWGIPLIGGGLAYTSIVCAAGSLRKKNDQWNHVCGGIAAASVFGTARRSIMFGIITGAATVFLGVLYKESVLCNYEIFPTPLPRKRGFAFSHKTDFSTQKDIPGNWYKEETPQPTPSPSKSC